MHNVNCSFPSSYNFFMLIDGALDHRLEEAGITTTCELTTYEPDAQEDIPLDRDSLAQKIIIKVCS